MKYIKPLTESILPLTAKALLADSLVDGGSPVDDVSEGDTEGWGNWN